MVGFPLGDEMSWTRQRWRLYNTVSALNTTKLSL